MIDPLLAKCAATMGIAMVPVLELRGSIPFGLTLGLSPEMAFVMSVIGNLIPVPAVMLLIRSVFQWLSRWPWWERKIAWLETRAHLKGRMVKKYRLLGLTLLVAIPLPGTGAWTGALVATLLDIRIRIALPCIFVGVLIAGGIIIAVSCGVIHIWGLKFL